MSLQLTEVKPAKKTRRQTTPSQNPPPTSQQEVSLVEVVENQINNMIPFKDYASLSKYLQQDPLPADASIIESYLLTQHIPNEVNCTNDAILDFAQLMYCNEKIATAAFDKLYKLVKQNKTTCTEVLGAIVIACDALQSQSYGKPENVEFIKLLVLLTSGVVKTNIDLTSVPNSLFVVRALAAINAVFGLLIMRGVSNPEGFAAMGDIPHQELSKFFEDLKTNLEKFKDQYPWPYFLCCRAQQSLEAVKSIRTVVQESKHKKMGRQEIVKAIVQALKGLLELGAGTATLGIAIATTIAGAGAPAPILAPAIIAFGSSCFTTGDNVKEVVGHVREAYSHLHGQTATSLNSFQRSVRISTDVKSQEWVDIKKLLKAMLNTIEKVKKSTPIDEWKDVDKMAVVYYFTEILALAKTQKSFKETSKTLLENIRDVFIKIYKTSDKKDMYVRTFILDSFDRLSQNKKYQEFFPALSVKNYADHLISAEQGTTEYKTLLEQLEEAIKSVEESAAQRFKMVTDISAHKLVQIAWFRCFKNDENLYVLYDNLIILRKRVLSNQLSNAQAWKEFKQIYRIFNKTEFLIALKSPDMTSDWGQKYFENLSREVSGLNLPELNIKEEQLEMLGKAKWRIAGQFVKGNKTEFIGLRGAPEEIQRLFGTSEEKNKFMLDTQEKTAKAEIEYKKIFGNSIDNEFLTNLQKYVDLDIKEGAVFVSGNHELFIAIELIHTELVKKVKEDSQKEATPFWKLPAIQMNPSPALKRNFNELKKKGYAFNVTLISGLSANTKSAVRIKAVVPSNFLDEDVEKDLGWLKTQMSETLKSCGIKEITLQEGSDGCSIDLMAEPAVLQSVHALLFDLAQRKYEDVQVEAENQKAKYECNVM